MTTIPLLAPAALLAWLVARRVPSPRQRVIAATLTGLLAINVGRPWLAPGSDADVASWALWWALTAGAVWSVLLRQERKEDRNGDAEEQRPRAAVRAQCRERYEHGEFSSAHAGIMLTAAALASPIAYRHGVDVARLAFAISLAAQALAVLRFVSRGRWPDDAQRVALILAMSSAADLAGPWRVGSPSDLWYVQQITSALTWAAIAGWEIRCLTRARR